MKGFEDSKGKEKAEDWTAFHGLVEVAVAARGELEKEKLMKQTMSQRQGLKIDIAVDNSPDSFKKATLVHEGAIKKHKRVAFRWYVRRLRDNPSSKKPPLMKEKPFTNKSSTGRSMKRMLVEDKSKKYTNCMRLISSKISMREWKTEQVSIRNPFDVFSQKQSSMGKMAIEVKRVHKRCVESGETSGVKNPQLRKQKQYCMDIVGPDETQPGLPERLKKMIRDMEGTDEKLIIQKPLFKTDCSKHHGRLSIPVSKVKVEFLTDDEKNMLVRSNGNNSMGIEALLIEPSLQTRKVILKRWDMGKESGKNSSIYVLVREWNSVLEDNDMKIHDLIQLWSFRVKSALCFALVIVRRAGIQEGEAAMCNA
ncbi:putative B3 domain-containing protein At3g24850 [Herrania umbratica]|uniref:B3 domain-containing protein At3g24850 n=1 Tax=Herrania umbratica TaxID=108875 RepID=A0A6J1BEK0_9ROSI|nr:putative B3 domain-containing protein At3g24850 [Herrania umbratica]